MGRVVGSALSSLPGLWRWTLSAAEGAHATDTPAQLWGPNLLLALVVVLQPNPSSPAELPGGRAGAGGRWESGPAHAAASSSPQKAGSGYQSRGGEGRREGPHYAGRVLHQN